MFAWLKNVGTSKSEANRSNFASVASHELRTPLSIIKWYTEILLDEDMGPLNEDQKKYLRVIESSNERAISLVTSLLNVSRLELDTFSVSPEPLLFTQVLEEVLKKQEKKASNKKISIVKEITGEELQIQLDRALTTLLIKSLLDNAIIFSKEGGEIKVSVHNTPSLLTMSVKDGGVGIKETEKSLIFTKMFRGSNVSDESKGAGLSLYIIKVLLSKLGGTLMFTSEENVGSTFTLNLPTTGMSKKNGTTRLDV
jgi:signal transduction histidine kinase